MPQPVIYRVEGLQPRNLSAVRFHGERLGGNLSHVTPPEQYRVQGRSAPQVLLFDRLGRELEGPAASGFDWVYSIRDEISGAAKHNMDEQVANLKARRSPRANRRAKEGCKAPYRRQKSGGPLREIFLGAGSDFFQDKNDEPGMWDKKKTRHFISRSIAFLKKEWGTALRYIRVDLDEGAPHIHAIAAPWVDTKTKMGAKQRMLNPAKLPNYRTELAQDRVADAMAPLGLVRGQRTAEARRVAKEEGLPPPMRAKHKRPAQWRAERAAELDLREKDIALREMKAEDILIFGESLDPKSAESFETRKTIELVQAEAAKRAADKAQAIEQTKTRKSVRDAEARRRTAVAKAAREKAVNAKIKKVRTKARGNIR